MNPRKGDKVYHRADPRRTRSIVITTGAVVVRRIEDGAHVVSAYDPDELAVVGQPTWTRDADPEDSVDMPLPKLDGEVFTEFDPARHLVAGAPPVKFVIDDDHPSRAILMVLSQPLCEGCYRYPGPGGKCAVYGTRTISDGLVVECSASDVDSAAVLLSRVTGESVTERAELDVEDARETLANAGWTLYRPATGPGADAEESERMAHQLAERGWAVVWPDGSFAGELLNLIREATCADVLVSRGWAVFQRENGDYAALPLPDKYEAEMLRGVDPAKLSAALVDKGWTVAADEDGSRLYPPGQPAVIGGHAREITEDTLEAIENCYCLACDHWLALRLDGDCGDGKTPEGPADTCVDWVRTEPVQARELAPVTLTVTDLALEEASAVLKEAGYTVVAQSELPEPVCHVCEHWGSELPEPCTKDMTPDYDDPQPCDRFQHRWQDVAEHLSSVAGHLTSVVARAHVERAEQDALPETEQPPAPAYPTPPTGLEDDTLAAQLDWLRANDLPTGTGAGKKAKTALIVKLLRLGYYDPATVEELTGELQWPPEAARCPVVGEDGEPCGSETPEGCEHPLP